MIHVTIPDLLELEELYPGLTRDMDTCVWQVEIIKKQAERDG